MNENKRVLAEVGDVLEMNNNTGCLANEVAIADSLGLKCWEKDRYIPVDSKYMQVSRIVLPTGWFGSYIMVLKCTTTGKEFLYTLGSTEDYTIVKPHDEIDNSFENRKTIEDITGISRLTLLSVDTSDIWYYPDDDEFKVEYFGNSTTGYLVCSVKDYMSYVDYNQVNYNKQKEEEKELLTTDKNFGTIQTPKKIKATKVKISVPDEVIVRPSDHVFPLEIQGKWLEMPSLSGLFHEDMLNYKEGTGNIETKPLHGFSDAIDAYAYLLRDNILNNKIDNLNKTDNLNKIDNLNNKIGDTNMTQFNFKAKATEQRTFIFGVDLATLTEEDLLQAVTHLKDEVVKVNALIKEYKEAGLEGVSIYNTRKDKLQEQYALVTKALEDMVAKSSEKED